jgi:hypothetical protein
VKEYKRLQIIKHALQVYIERHNADEKDLEQEKNLLEKVELEISDLKEKYGIS